LKSHLNTASAKALKICTPNYDMYMFVHFTLMLLLSLLFANYNLLCKRQNYTSKNYLIVM
jgi:hypothetical protein